VEPSIPAATWSALAYNLMRSINMGWL